MYANTSLNFLKVQSKSPMFRFFHLKAFLTSAYYGNRWRMKQILGINVKPRTDVLNSGLGPAVERYNRICKTILRHINDKKIINDAIVCEIGCGDCLAAADMMLGLGAKHVHLVDYIPMVVSELHSKALAPLVSDLELPNNGSILTKDSPPRLNDMFATFHQGLLENVKLPETVDFLYSFDVLEHVEDLDGFFAYCGEIVKPGGMMVHKFDLSGHGSFEDPIPPLDFQTLPTWLFDFIFPKYNRAVGNFADQFLAAMERHGFTELKIVPIRVADPVYLDEVWPHLRREARFRDKEIIKLLDLVVMATKRTI